LKQIARQVGPIQLVYAGKAHPRDEGGKAIIRRIFEAAAVLANDVRVAYLENYDMALGNLRRSGVEVWLNTPLGPQEASGTTVIKSALNTAPTYIYLLSLQNARPVYGLTACSTDDSGTENNPD